MEQSVIYQISKNDLSSLAEELIKKHQNKRLDTDLYHHSDRLTQKKACEFLEITQPTIKVWREQLELPHMQIGTKYYYSKKLLIDYCKSRTKPGFLKGKKSKLDEQS